MLTLSKFLVAPSLAVILLFSMPLGASQTNSTVQRVQFRASAQVSAGDDKEGGFWFEAWDTYSRFVAEGISPDQVKRLREVLATATEEGRSVDLVYDAAKARWNEQVGILEYPVCSVNIDEMSFTSPKKCSDKVSGRLKDAARLAIGYAEARDGSPQAARLLLAPLITANSGSPDFRSTVLKARATALRALADHAVERSRGRDSALALSLIDSRAFAASNPDDIDAQLEVANLLRELGAYEAAEAEFRKVIARWPEQEENVGVSLALVARTRGHTQESLAILDGIIARHGRQEGMRFNYHRAWSLLRLERFDEAIAALNEGIKSQPDFAWAYVHRACGYANIGRPDFALADIETAIGIIEKFPIPEETPVVRRNRERLAEFHVLLKKAATEGDHSPKPQVCTGFDGDGEKPRPRSALLDATVDELEKELFNLE